MTRHLLIAVHLHADGMGTARYHGMHQGAPEWPPAPARIFQAMVAGVARGHNLPEPVVPGLRWLEALPPPVIAAPRHTVGQAVALYVPNNDADAVADPSDVSSIRTAKQVQPSLFNAAQPLLYAWRLPEGDCPEQAMVDSAHAVYQLGRGVDMAWADARVLPEDELQTVLLHYRGIVHQPSSDTRAGRNLPCPMPGALDSLVLRHRAPRLRVEGVGKKARVLFTNAPKPRFASVSYAPSRRLALYDLRAHGTTKPWPWPWPQHRAAALVENVRDAAADRLRQALPDAAEAIERSLIGRAADGSGGVPLAQRVHIVPLPSIGSVHADQAIRRVLVEIPGGCPLAAEDLDWAFSGLQAIDGDTGEVAPWMLTRSDQAVMLAHYTVPSQHWQSVTPLALPEAAARRRIDPARHKDAAEAKRADERLAEEGRAVAAVHRALRHAGVPALAVQVRVQREPFTAHGKRSEPFAEGSRFAKERLWHVALCFDRPVSGPLAIGDGRFLGLGVLAPSNRVAGLLTDPAAWTGAVSDGIAVVQLAEGAAGAPPELALDLARALRRAVMARVSDVLGSSARAALNAYFSGHASDSTAPDAEPSRHLAFHWDGPRQRWVVLAPHRLERRHAFAREREHLVVLQQALQGLTDLRAGAAGRHAVQTGVLARGDDPLLAAASVWESVTPYDVTRHRRKASATEALAADVLAECMRCHLPRPQVTVLSACGVPGRGLQARLRLAFPTPIAGPVALGRSSLLGGGLFAGIGALAVPAMDSDSAD
ncbi:type I-G CRISPR-associated protein Csb2 [Aquabacterium sp. OR-4]|uniref:type I-G CRISPR-associated protein Csb2 n=1 Tax=Aquabacterium sp. OR-4 TaxID=2978127 RepID=UPI0021B22023|nr:type I-U CRISPR-associated protein Csb2 [Aquabacterium sp. OR-4]MDT7838345.1 type I-U CRISPR-associated protein Csb2 [Aquabacterium sp. OR-4]